MSASDTNTEYTTTLFLKTPVQVHWLYQTNIITFWLHILLHAAEYTSDSLHSCFTPAWYHIALILPLIEATLVSAQRSFTFVLYTSAGLYIKVIIRSCLLLRCILVSVNNLPESTTSHSAQNLGFIFNEHLTFSDQISSVSKSCYCHIRQLRCIRPYLNSITASAIATSTVHSKLDYCNSLYHNLPKSQITRLQQIQNSLARAVVKAPKSCSITPILRSLHWLKITERIEYKLLSLVTGSSYKKAVKLNYFFK